MKLFYLFRFVEEIVVDCTVGHAAGAAGHLAENENCLIE